MQEEVKKSAEQVEKEKEEMVKKVKEGEKKDEKKAEKPEEKMDEKPEDIQTLFEEYSKFGDKNGHKGISLKNAIKWFSQAEILGGKEEYVTKDDVTKAYKSIAKEEDRVKFADFRKIVRNLATDKKMIDEELLRKMVAAGSPKISGVSDFFSTICKSCRS